MKSISAKVMPVVIWMLLPFGAIANATILVDFGAGSDQNSFGLAGWNTVIKSTHTNYSSAGPAGLVLVAASDNYDTYQGVQGTIRNFIHGERILVTWYNNGAEWLHFTPLISFQDSNNPVDTEGEPQWYGMKYLTTYRTEPVEFAPGETLQTYYDFTSTATAPAGLPPTEGSYSVVNVCMNQTVPGLLIDKIELVDGDLTAPGAPANLQATAHSTQPDSKINLDWDVAADNVAVTHYRIYRNGRFVHTSKTNNFTDCLLAPGTNYTYTVTAMDGCRNESGHSNIASRSTAGFQGRPTLINPFKNLKYIGAFKLPTDTVAPYVDEPWIFREGDLAYYPAGDPAGSDAYPGSLFLSGIALWDSYGWVAEIGIPVPVKSAAKNPDQLNTATTLHHFTNIRPANIPYTVGEDPYLAMGTAIEYMGPRGSQTQGKLYTAFGDFFYFEKKLTHGASEPDLSTVYGGWSIGPVDDNDNPPYNTLVRYIFDIPQTWADTYTAGRSLLIGGSRYGDWPNGPALHAIAPWQDGSPLPTPGTALSYTTLLRYENNSGSHFMDGLLPDDPGRFVGAEWLATGDKSAVIFIASKSFGESWYGLNDGTDVYNELQYNVPYIEYDYLTYGEKGPRSTSYSAMFLFYDPDDLAAVAQGTKQPYEPQPYAALDIDALMYRPNTGGQLNPNIFRVDETGYDAERGLLYVAENRAYGIEYAYPLIHVWRVQSTNSLISPITQLLLD